MFPFEIRFAEAIFPTFSLPFRNFFSYHSLILLLSTLHRIHRAIKFELVRALHETPSRKQSIASKTSKRETNCSLVRRFADENFRIFATSVLVRFIVIVFSYRWITYIPRTHCTFSSHFQERKSIISDIVLTWWNYKIVQGILFMLECKHSVLFVNRIFYLFKWVSRNSL